MDIRSQLGPGRLEIAKYKHAHRTMEQEEYGIPTAKEIHIKKLQSIIFKLNINWWIRTRLQTAYKAKQILWLYNTSHTFEEGRLRGRKNQGTYGQLYGQQERKEYRGLDLDGIPQSRHRDSDQHNPLQH